MSINRNVTIVFILHSIATNGTFEMALLKKQKAPSIRHVLSQITF
jgi:hypothetical protein